MLTGEREGQITLCCETILGFVACLAEILASQPNLRNAPGFSLTVTFKTSLDSVLCSLGGIIAYLLECSLNSVMK